jgi:hypothetical protein
VMLASSTAAILIHWMNSYVKYDVFSMYFF